MAPTRPRPWRYLLAVVLAGGFMFAYELAGALLAPDVPTTCAKLLELAEQAGESTSAADRDSCERRYAQLRAQRGLLGWGKLARCVDRAMSIPDAGGC